MISVIITNRVTRSTEADLELAKMYAWLATYAIDHWGLTRLTVDKIKIDFWGIDKEQEVVAFKLKFGGIGGYNGKA